MTTLTSLKKYSKRDAQRLLSDVTLSLLPHPVPNGVTSVREDENAQRQVLEESRQKLNLGLDDESQEARTRLLEFLGDEISSSVLGGANINSIKDRLIEHGDLSPSEYELHLEPQFKDFIGLNAIDEALVLETLVHPDGVEHMPSGKQPDGSLAGASIYVRNFGRGEERFALLILSLSRGMRQYPSSAWRVFFSDVDLQSARTPMDVLKAFLNSYGVEFQLGNHPPTKFVQRELLPAPPNLKVNFKFSLRDFLTVSEPTDQMFLHNDVRYSALGFIVVEFVFCLASSRYISDMKRHGIDVAWKVDAWDMNVAELAAS